MSDIVGIASPAKRQMPQGGVDENTVRVSHSGCWVDDGNVSRFFIRTRDSFSFVAMLPNCLGKVPGSLLLHLFQPDRFKIMNMQVWKRAEEVE